MIITVIWLKKEWKKSKNPNIPNLTIFSMCIIIPFYVIIEKQDKVYRTGC